LNRIIGTTGTAGLSQSFRTKFSQATIKKILYIVINLDRRERERESTEIYISRSIKERNCSWINKIEIFSPQSEKLVMQHEKQENLSAKSALWEKKEIGNS